MLTISNCIDKEVKCISNISGSGLAIDKKYFIKSIVDTNLPRPTVYVSKTKGGPIHGGWLYLDELKEINLTKGDIELKIANLQEEIKVLTSKLDFIAKNRGKEFNEEVYKAYLIMQRLELGSIEDAEYIVKILEN
jgi:hypothetical protein